MRTKESTGSFAEHHAFFLARAIVVAAGLWLACCSGCTSVPQIGHWEGPTAPAAVSFGPWSNGPPGARAVRTAHYEINTTITDDDFLKQTAQVMEGALTEYRQLAPAVKVSDSPMQCYLFSSRAEWEAFTVQLTGPQSSIFLQINRGGYCFGDQYVAYDIGQSSTLSVAAHEGWHQFVARHFTGRLPPFLEEGLATTFETMRWQDGLPQWNLSINSQRVLGLRRSIERHALWPLDTLVTLNAGSVVSGSGEKIDAFYSQDWAFADFLYSGENGSRRPMLLRMIADAAAGKIRDPTGHLRRAYLGFDPAGSKPLIVDYLGGDLSHLDQSFADIDKDFQAYMDKLAYEELMSQYQD